MKQVKRFGSVWVLLLFFTTAQAQFSTKDAVLDRRLQEYMDYNKKLDFTALVNYLHPSLFKIVPKEELLQTFADAFTSKDIAFRFDTILPFASSAAYTHQNTTYRKVDYYMVMQMKMTDSATYSDTEFRSMMIENLETGFSGKTVLYNTSTNAFVIKGNEILFALKEKGRKEWYFLGYEKKPELMALLFPDAVLQYFKLL